ncbi:hypothetical protein F0562_028772 [Nyssa sinensis]|uniref:DUF4378 domain-containing protein n=1 Tax=Nyssa sinensis TaxID=561372 RepID=A0A5J5B107_9ASTE|nr:hypothetical protein F0562_028772 [Nyssa sinensis]
MAASTSIPVPGKQLVELLQDQQEPFTLDAYLTERNYTRKNSISESMNSSNLKDSTKSLTRTCSSNAKRRMGLPYGSRTLMRSVLDTLISYKNHRKLSSNNHKAQKGRGEKDSKTSKAETIRLCDSCSKCNVKEHYPTEQNHASSSQSTFQASKFRNPRELEAASNTILQWGCMEDSKQLSPVSVLEELPSEEGFPIAKNNETVGFFLSKKATEGSIFAPYPSKLFIQSLKEKKKRVGLAETERLGKMICEQMHSWGNQRGDVTNIIQLISFDFSNTMEKWSDFQPLAREIGMEIGDAILADIITEMIDVLGGV